METIKNLFLNWRKNLMLYTWWEIVIFVFGSVSFLTILLILFYPLRSGPSTFTTTSPVPAVTSSEFIHTLSDSLTLPIEQGDSIEILNNGDAFMSSFLADIDAAHSSINIMVYIWDAGKMSDQIFEHLDAKLKEGVPVRVMLDAYGGLGATKRKEFKTFKDLGGKVQVFHSLTIVPWNIIRNQSRNHRRAFIIDGKVGYAGGLAIGDSWLGDARNAKEYRDIMFRMTGSMAANIQGAFAELWTSNTGEFLVGKDFYPLVTKDTTSTIKYIPLSSTPSPDSLVMQKFILLSLLGAEQKIYISTPYFIPDQSLKDVLKAKAKSGVDVRILVPNDYNDNRGVRKASQKSYEDLLESGVKIYEYQPTFIHVKTMIIDGIWSVIGSANIDKRSRKLNEENIFGISDKGFGTKLENIFLLDINNAQEINLTEWQKRGLWQRVKEIFALKFAQQY